MEIPGITFPLLGDFVWDFLPYFTVFGWKIYWYGVIIAVGFLLIESLQLFVKVFKFS